MRQPIFLLLCTLLLATTAPKPTIRPTKDHALFFAIQDHDAWTDLKKTIRDTSDRYTTEAKKNLQSTVAPDRDHDGIVDAIDRCPAQTGTVSNNGCPLPTPVPTGMVLVQGGTFQMGDVMGDKEKEDETVHTVTLNNFFLAKNEVTFNEFNAFCKATGRKLPDHFGWGCRKCPVIGVDWYDAVEYCNWRSEQEGLQPVYSITHSLNHELGEIKGQEGLQPVYSVNKNKDPNNSSISDEKKWLVTTSRSANGYRLPTEAEWEYAARQGGQKVRFGNGKDIANPEEINFDASPVDKISYSIFGDEKDIANPKEINFDASLVDKISYSVTGKYRDKTVPVGSLGCPNALGLNDMSGNVSEWCGDWYGTYPSSANNDPQGATGGSHRVVRGGSWSDRADDVRVADRLFCTPDGHFIDIGFRLARTAVAL